MNRFTVVAMLGVFTFRCGEPAPTPHESGTYPASDAGPRQTAPVPLPPDAGFELPFAPPDAGLPCAWGIPTRIADDVVFNAAAAAISQGEAVVAWHEWGDGMRLVSRRYSPDAGWSRPQGLGLGGDPHFSVWRPVQLWSNGLDTVFASWTDYHWDPIDSSDAVQDRSVSRWSREQGWEVPTVLSDQVNNVDGSVLLWYPPQGVVLPSGDAFFSWHWYRLNERSVNVDVHVRAFRETTGWADSALATTGAIAIPNDPVDWDAIVQTVWPPLLLNPGNGDILVRPDGLQPLLRKRFGDDAWTPWGVGERTIVAARIDNLGKLVTVSVIDANPSRAGTGFGFRVTRLDAISGTTLETHETTPVLDEIHVRDGLVYAVTIDDFGRVTALSTRAWGGGNVLLESRNEPGREWTTPKTLRGPTTSLFRSVLMGEHRGDVRAAWIERTVDDVWRPGNDPENLNQQEGAGVWVGFLSAERESRIQRLQDNTSTGSGESVEASLSVSPAGHSVLSWTQAGIGIWASVCE